MGKISIIMKCHSCGKEKDLNGQEQAQAQRDGYILCGNCFTPMVLKCAGGVL